MSRSVEEIIVDLRRFGRDVPEGDGWSWDWQVDKKAVEAIDKLRELELALKKAKKKIKKLDEYKFMYEDLCK